MRRLLTVLLVVVALGGVAHAQGVKTGAFTLNRGGTAWGTFAALTSTVAPTTWVECGGAVNTLAVQWAITGTSATATLEWSLDEGATWWVVTDSTTTASTGQTITNPSSIRYRPKLTACTSCSVVLTWRCTSSL